MSSADYFEKVDKKADELFAAEKYTETIALLEQAYEEFPEQYFYITFYLLVCYRALEQFDKCLAIIGEAGQKGYFFSLQWPSWDPIRALDGYEAIIAENERLRVEAQQSAKMHFEVHLPDGYMPDKRYPLFLTLHGDGSDIETHRQYWPPDVMLKRGFIVVYVQSSRIVTSSGYDWTDNTTQRRKDIRQCYDEVLAAHAVDSQRVIVSGFSGGASAAIDVVLNDTLPARGFIALCPDKPEDFSKEIVENADSRGIRGVIMEGEQSGSVPDQQEMTAIFKEVGLPYVLTLNEGVGHWYPADLAAKLDKAIDFILSE